MTTELINCLLLLWAHITIIKIFLKIINKKIPQLFPNFIIHIVVVAVYKTIITIYYNRVIQ